MLRLSPSDVAKTYFSPFLYIAKILCHHTSLLYEHAVGCTQGIFNNLSLNDDIILFKLILLETQLE